MRIAFDRITGTGRLQVALAGSGRSQAAVMHALHGNAAFTFKDGALRASTSLPSRAAFNRR